MRQIVARVVILFWFSVKLRRDISPKEKIPPFGRGFSRHKDLSVRCVPFFLGGTDFAAPLIDHRPR